MKGFGVFCLIIGLLLLGAGFGIQHYADNLEEVEKINAGLVLVNQEKISPEFVSDLLNGQAIFVGKSFTLESLLKDMNVENADQLILAMKIYSYTPQMIRVGAALAILGLLLAIFVPEKKRRNAYYA